MAKNLGNFLCKSPTPIKDFVATNLYFTVKKSILTTMLLMRKLTLQLQKISCKIVLI